MSALTWPEALRQALDRQRPQGSAARLAVIGIGHELAGDDAAGIAVVHELNSYFVPPSGGGTLRQGAHADAELKQDPFRGDAIGENTVLALEGGAAPENLTGPLRRFQPHVVLLVDAADIGEPAGTVRWLDPSDATGFTASTHILPLHLLAEYLRSELGCEVALLGIQPERLTVAAPLSPAVAAAVTGVARELRQIAGT